LRVDRSGGVPLVVMLGVLTMLRRAHAADHWPGDRLGAFEARDAAAGRMGDKSPRWAAIGFACTTGYASAVALRENLPGEPFGLRVPISVRAGILTGWGSSVAAPWPMPVVGLLAVRRSARGGGGNKPALVCTALGVAGIVGVLIEPNTYRARNWTRSTRRAILLHVGSCVALAVAGLWQAASRAWPIYRAPWSWRSRCDMAPLRLAGVTRVGRPDNLR
jgi:hypothetical protein